jgi:hypothetical protein
MNSSLIIIFLIFAVLFLLYKYQQINKKNKIVKVTRPRRPKQKTYMNNRNVMPHMTYSAGPFDETIWNYPHHGGKTITSRKASPRGLGQGTRPMPPGPTYIGKYPYYHREFNGPF